MKRLPLVVVALVVLAGGAGLLAQRLAASPDPGTLYGNVEIRQVDLAFEVEGKVVTMPRHEGDHVKPGETVAAVDPATYQNATALAEARRDAAKAQLDELLAGTRPEDIDQARANYAAAQASLADAQATFARQKDLAARNVSSQQALDDARMAMDLGGGAAGTNPCRDDRGDQRPAHPGHRRKQGQFAGGGGDAGSVAHRACAHQADRPGRRRTVMTRVIEPRHCRAARRRGVFDRESMARSGSAPLPPNLCWRGWRPRRRWR